MSRSVLFLALSLISSPAFAAGVQFKCNAVNRDGAFTDGYSVLTLNTKSVRIDYYYVNTVARETTIDYSGTYAVGGAKGGSGKLAPYRVLTLQRLNHRNRGNYDGGIRTMYLQPELLRGGTTLRNGGRGGFYAFVGHGYSYDWNICSRK